MCLFLPIKLTSEVLAKNKLKTHSWLNDEVIITRQFLSELVENETSSLTKIDHSLFFRSRFLKSKLLFNEVNELREEESSSKNHSYIQKEFGHVVDSNGELKKDELLLKLKSIKDNEFKYQFLHKDLIDGPILQMCADRKVSSSVCQQ